MQHSTSQAPNRGKPVRLSWQDPKLRALVYQALVIGLVIGMAWYLVHNTLHNLSTRNIATGFSFLEKEAGFSIGETVIDYSPADTYGRAILVGLANTAYVSIIGLFWATLLGTVIGIARLSTNWLAARLASLYIQCVRNVPLLLQLLVWYALISQILPGPRAALHPVPGVFLSNRGLLVPAIEGGSTSAVTAGILLAIVAAFLATSVRNSIQRRTGSYYAIWPWTIAMLVAFPMLGWVLTGMDLQLDTPHLSGFSFAGGWNFSPELFALLAGLITYTAAFIAEIVRSGIQSVNKGQWEAALSLGIKRSRALRLVILPQALRVIVPPTTSQYLNLIKHSSLAVAIGYPDLVSIVNTTLNQTGQAIEGILIIMCAFLTVSLAISLLMNLYNKRIALVER
ncbi:amino acid ABC transporter permease [Cupriavidus taiwanensis]|uniref:amino acid ABC transporter permease n=1 Tax=Cupriavidus taiwanensis TaxID=164546 RepID=UPI0039C04892